MMDYFDELVLIGWQQDKNNESKNIISIDIVRFSMTFK